MAINTTPVPPKVWKRYVDDSFCITKRNAVDSFHNSLNGIDQHISFTIEGENNNQIAFLNILVTRKDNTLIVEVYRKQTQTDRYLDFYSHHDKRHKISAAETLLYRATNLPNTKQGKETELTHVTDALRFNNCLQNVISNILKKKSSTQRTNSIPAPEELVCMFFKWAAPSDFSNYAVLSYINGISQPLTRLLKKHDIRVVSKPFKTLQQAFPSPKSRPPIDCQPNVVYKIPCADCLWNYLGETGRCFETRKKEHMRNVKSFARGSNIAKHAWSSNHSIDLKNSQVIDNRICKTLESWHTTSTSHADNNSRLPSQYSILLKKNN